MPLDIVMTLDMVWFHKRGAWGPVAKEPNAREDLFAHAARHARGAGRESRRNKDGLGGNGECDLCGAVSAWYLYVGRIPG